MSKITFLGAGSTVFAKNLIGDAFLLPNLSHIEIALYDINETRLAESFAMAKTLNKNLNNGRAHIEAFAGVSKRKQALKGADYVINTVQVGGYDPSTIIDFEIPKKFGLRQTIGDTLGIGGIFRALRTIPVVLDCAHDMEEVCPNAWFLNYVNPMAMITGALLLGSKIKTVGLCHSVQVCAHNILGTLDMLDSLDGCVTDIAGINHQAWLLRIEKNGVDLYPEIKKRTVEKLAAWRKTDTNKHSDLIRLDIVRNFGYYVTESSEHNAEYMPYWIKSAYPELIKEFNIPLDEYPKRCIDQISKWKTMSHEIVNNPNLTHTMSNEYGARIINAMDTNLPMQIHGNILNKGHIPNLPENCVVEVPCLVSKSGISGCVVGNLPEQCAAINRTNVNVHMLTIEAALRGKRDAIYHAAFLDPHTSAELPLDTIRHMCDELIEAHGDFLPKYN